MKLRIFVAFILACALVGTATATTITPIAMSNRSLGGKDLNEYTFGVVGALGPNNVGLLVKTWGKVTWVDATAQYFYVDDGSGLSDGTRRTDNNLLVFGVRVSYGNLAADAVPVSVPSERDIAVVTGISSVVVISGQSRPNLRVRKGPDVLVLH